MPSDESCALSWTRRWWRALVGEALATALLVALGVASLLPLGAAPTPLTHPALGFGLVIVLLVEAFGPVSGAHMNPAVTLAAALTARLPPAAAVAYALAQLAGALLGFGALWTLAPAAALRGGAGVTRPAHGVSPLQAAGVEAVMVAALVLLVAELWRAHEQRGPDAGASLKLGLAIAGLVYAGGEMSGASLNPARSFGPAALHNDWRDHWVYWAGPLAGSLLATLLHRFVLHAPSAGRAARPAHPAHPAAAHEQLPLTDKQAA